MDMLREAPCGVALFDSALVCVDVNPSLARFVGAAEGELVGRRAEEVLPRVAGLAERLREVRDGRRPDELDVAGAGAAEARQWHLSLFPATVAPGGPGVGVIVTDVTDQKRTVDELRGHEEWFRSTLETIPQMVWVGDPDGSNVYNNARLSEYTGLPPEALYGDGWTRTIHPDDVRTAYTVWTHAVEAREPFTLIERIRRHDGEYRWFLAAGAPLRDASGRVRRWIGTWTDIHDRIEAQRELQDADRRKNEFLAMLSHELRNPLAPIQLAIKILERADANAAQARRAREVIGRQTALLARLIGDLLDVTRITRGKIELRRERVDLSDLAARIAEDHRGTLEDRQLTLDVSVPPEPLWIDGDEARLSQVVGNLLQNAAKFTGPGGRVTLQVRAAPSGAEVSVTDTGVGIPPQLVDRVFEPFTQGEQTLARTHGGLGLGLALVKGLTQLHGGSVAVRSEGQGKGAQFVVTLPVPAPAR